MDGVKVNDRVKNRLDPFRLPQEKVVVAMQEHWAARAEPIATAILGFFLVIAIGSIAPARMGILTNAAWWLWFILVVRVAWVLINWQFSYFVATDKRLLLLYGIITRKVAMMPMIRVTDMGYTRSPIGRLLGYGTFVLESAGQDQALSRISWVRDPDYTYRLICGQIFGTGDDDNATSPETKKPESPSDGDGSDKGPKKGPDGPRKGPSGGPGKGPRKGPSKGPDGGPSKPKRPREPAPPVPESTDVPLHRLGSYLEPTPTERPTGAKWHKRHERHESLMSSRVVRRARTTRQDLKDAQNDPGWAVSREDVSPHHPVDASGGD
ncbi:PH domain-containing protein [Luteipulveratus mongoliensis]|uniref:PH domain-containing protein n=1 Tax=Luteipulveratus mongoliensis TaxID=571913 RepID=UPI000695CC97|nr:PH domain-containing protein [Luteipulveratus mongoliensis]